MTRTLAIVPTYIRSARELDVTMTTLTSLTETAPDADILVVDDGSPAQDLVSDLQTFCRERSEWTGLEFEAKQENTGFSSTVNVGLRKALAEGRDAVLVNADVEFEGAGWLEAMLARTDSNAAPAAVVGALLLYPNGLIQHGGIYVSFLDRGFDHRFRFAPRELVEAHVPHNCPVTGALQLIRHATLETVGLYDDVNFRLGFEDVDYCLRTYEAGLECWYEPGAIAIHHESLFRGQRSDKIDEMHKVSTQALHNKHAATDLSRWIPAL